MGHEHKETSAWIADEEALIGTIERHVVLESLSDDAADSETTPDKGTEGRCEAEEGENDRLEIALAQYLEDQGLHYEKTKVLHISWPFVARSSS